MRNLTKTAIAALGTLMALSSAQAVTITAYSSNFDAAATVAAGVTASLSGAAVQSVQGYSALGNGGNVFGGNFLSSYASSSVATLTLSGLPTHSSINITSLLGIIDSWDSTDGGCCAPDFFRIYVDGAIIFSDTYNTVLGTVNNTALLTDIGGGIAPRGFSGWNDQAFDLESELQNIVHSASTLTIELRGEGGGWQGGDDEGWGVDNLLVQLNGVTVGSADVPEPITLSLLGAGLAGIGMARRKRA